MSAPAGLPVVGRRAGRSARSRAGARTLYLTVAPSRRVDGPTFWGWPQWLSPVYRAEGQRSAALTIEVQP